MAFKDMKNEQAPYGVETQQVEELIITRMFDAPREQVWKYWSDPELVKQWWGPKGFTAPVAKIDFRVGGEYLMCMRSPEGKDYWSTGIYRIIMPHERIECTDSFSDENGNIVPASQYGMSGDFPLEMFAAITFENIGGKTKLTLRHLGFPSESDRDMAKEGWSQSLDKLEEVISEL